MPEALPADRRNWDGERLDLVELPHPTTKREVTPRHLVGDVLCGPGIDTEVPGVA